MKKFYLFALALSLTNAIFAQQNYMTVAELMTEYANLGLSSGKTASGTYTVRGYVTKWKDGYPDYQNATFYVDDVETGSTTRLQCFRLTASQSYDKFALSVGDYVEIQDAQLMNYYGSAELKNGAFSVITKKPISGQCGENVYYIFSNDTIRFTGTGDMTEDSYVMSELESYKGHIHGAIISEGVTSIKSSTFSDCINLTSITLPESLQTISFDAFQRSGLQSIAIPNNVTSIGNQAFSECMSLVNITLGNSIEYIDGDAFIKCKNLSTINMPNSLKYLGVTTFYGTNIYFDDTKWENGALYIDNCLITGSRTLPDDVSVLEELGIYTLPTELHVNSDYSIKEGTRLIAAGAFYTTEEWITKLTVPSTVEYVGSYAFWQSTLTELVWNATHCNDFQMLLPFGNEQYTENPFCLDALPNETIPEQYTHAYVQKISFAENVEYLPSGLCSRMPNLVEVHNYNPDPIVVSDNMFESVDYNNCILYVPQGSISKYAAAPVWCNFLHIQENAGTTGIDSSDSSTKPLKVLHNGQIIILRGDKTYTLQGQEVK